MKNTTCKICKHYHNPYCTRFPRWQKFETTHFCGEYRKKVVPRKQDGKTEYSENVKMFKKEYDKLCSEYPKAGVDKMIYCLTNYKKASGKVYKDDYAAILNWVSDKTKKDFPELFEKKIRHILPEIPKEEQISDKEKREILFKMRGIGK